MRSFKLIWLLAIICTGISPAFSQDTILKKTSEAKSQADSDWDRLIKFGMMAPHEESSAALKVGGYAAYVLCMEKHRRKALDLAEEFWDKYPEDERRKDQVFDLFRSAHMGVMTPWVDTLISVETAEKINRKKEEQDLQLQELQSRGERMATGPPLFRMFPRDFDAEAKWRKKRNEMAQFAMENASSRAEMEEVEWKVFTSDWGQVASMWSAIPSNNEYPDDQTEQLENEYWSLLAKRYWEEMYLRFDKHAMKYAELPVIADRALDFLGATARSFSSSVAAESYWERIVEEYGNPKQGDARYSLTDKAGVKALLKQASAQSYVKKVIASQIPLELEFEAMDGRQVDLKSLKGKVVIVDFWATWCQPCIASMPELKAIYNKYHKQGLEIIGVSLDNKGMDDQIQAVVDKYALPWPQRYESKGMNDPLAKLYAINALPTVWLLDREGKIISRNARGKVLEEMLEKLFAE